MRRETRSSLSSIALMILFGVLKKTLKLATFLFQLAYHHEDANSTGRPMRSYCSLGSSTFVACIPPCFRLWLSQCGTKYLSDATSFLLLLVLFFKVKATIDTHFLVWCGTHMYIPASYLFSFTGGLPHISWRILELF